MNVTGVTGSAAATANSKAILGKDDFLRLLCTQMEYQNPLDPMDPTEMMSQMTQLTQVEQLINMAKAVDSMNQVQWLTVMGKKVCVGSPMLAKGDQITLTPKGDYDKITLTLKKSDGTKTELVFKPGDPLKYTYGDDPTVAASATITKDGKTLNCGFKVYSTVSGMEVGDDSAIAILANGGRYNTDRIIAIQD
jgi:flagellar basal-body rod modification protein FlgD